MGRNEDLIDRMYALASETDAARRAELLDQTVSEDVEFYGLQVEAFGRDEFDRSFSDPEGTVLVRTSPVEQRERWIRCTWELRQGDGSVVQNESGLQYAGVQFSELDDQGRLRRIVPFLGLVPEDPGRDA